MGKFTGTNLFKPIKVGDVTLENRIVFPPLSRYRATKDNGLTDLIVDHYVDRSKNNGGLLIFEQTLVSGRAGHREYSPYMSDPQLWKPMVDEIHKNGSFFAIQMSALGRAANAKVSKERGVVLKGPSAIYIDSKSENDAKAAGNEIKEFTIEELSSIKKDFVSAARAAIDIGVDIIELHMANGYLFDQFIRETSNQRTDKYGGSIENRARFVLETIDEISEEIGASKLAVRFSPYSFFQGSGGNKTPVHPIAQFGYILSELQKRADSGNELAYVSFVEPVINGVVESDDEELKTLNPHWLEEIWRGVVLRSGNYLHEQDKLIENVNLNDRTLIGIGRYFSSNPDLPNRMKLDVGYTPYDRSTFYTHDNWGYNTFGEYGAPKITPDSEDAKKTPKPVSIN